MKIRTLTTACKVVACTKPAAAAAGSNLAITPIDMAGYESVLLILKYATGLDAADTPKLSATEGNVDSTGAYSDQTAVAGTATAALGSAVSFQTLELDRPTKRFIRPVVTCNGNNAYYDVTAILFNAKDQAAAGYDTQFGSDPSATPSLPLVPTAPTFNTTTGEFSGAMILTTPVVAAAQYAQVIANP